MKVKVRPFGKAFGKQAFRYLFTAENGAGCEITDLSGAIMHIYMPDKRGKLDDVALGFDDPRQYVKNPGYLGALIGPVGNRISGASFTFEGKNYRFTPNEGASTLLHSGDFGFHACVWDSECVLTDGAAQLILRHSFPNSETGFPGNLDVTVTYTFREDCSLKIEYAATSDAPSFMSPTNHTYFNLAGLSGKHIPRVDRQTVQIFADRYTEVGEGCIPVANIPVEGTPFDLRQPKKLKDGFALEKQNAQLGLGAGYDHNFVLSGDMDLMGLRRAAEVCDRLTGRVMNVYTDMPSVQLYTANHLRRYNPQQKRGYGKRQALCLETQCAPDSINRAGEDGFDVLRLDAEHPFKSSTVYVFSVKQ